MPKGRYNQIIEGIFDKIYVPGRTRLPFKREVITDVANELGIKVPKNLGDVIYSFRSRNDLPKRISETAPQGFEWLIQSEGSGLYAFSLKPALDLSPTTVASVLIPDSTPLLVKQYAQSDEQAILARIRYNRLMDIFTGLSCFHLQSHYRTQIPEIGQTETDELYVAHDLSGAHYILPIQAKGLKEKMSRIQIENDFAICRVKFPKLIAKPIAALQTSENTVVLFEFGYVDSELTKVNEAHYELQTLRDAVTRPD